MSYQVRPMPKTFVLSLWLSLFCYLALASEKPCPKLVAGEAPAVALMQFEQDYPLHERSLRAKFPRIYQQLMEEYETNPHILSFTRLGTTPEKATELMDRMAEGSNSVSKRVQSILVRVSKDLVSVEKNIARTGEKRGRADQLVPLLDRRDDLLRLKAVVEMAVKLFSVGPADAKTPFGRGTQLKWERFLDLRGEMEDQWLYSAEPLSLVFAELSQDFRRAWALVRVALCLPRLERVLVKSSELGVGPLVVSGQEIDRYLSMKFTDENGRAAIAELRSLARPVLFGTDNWAESLDAAEKLLGMGVHRRFKIHFFFTGGIDVEAKQVLESMDIAVHGPVLPSVAQ
jgi:hypothetical protein